MKFKDFIYSVIKSDVQGSAEAIVSSLKAIKNDDVGLDIIYSGVGAITESDANLAMSSNSKIIGFNVRADLQSKKLAKQQGVNIKYYSIIYEIFDEVSLVISCLLYTSPSPRDRQKCRMPSSA